MRGGLFSLIFHYSSNSVTTQGFSTYTFMHSEQSCTDLGQMYVAIYQSTFVKYADQTHHMVSGVCLLNSCLTLLSLLFLQP